LRVKKVSKIESPAKDSIFVIQNKLDDCYKLLKKKENIANNLLKLSETIQSIQKIDSNWPIDIYISEIEFLKKQNTIEAPSFNTSLKANNKQKKAERTDRNNAIPTSEQIEVSNKKDEDVEDSTCNMMATVIQQTLPITEQSASDTDMKENVSEESDKSKKTSTGVIVIIAILVLVTIRWISANTNLVFGGILILLTLLLCNGVGNPLFLGGGILIDIALWIIYYRYTNLYPKRCKQCKKWGVMRVIKEEPLGHDDIHVEKELPWREDSTGKKGTYTAVVQERVFYYRIHRKCKNCGAEDSQLVAR
ncbi:MAG: hypothetical protein K2H68_05555, partial [Bacteroidales bacterium]|nr:hypothetical protein [Bacteroidales bacterium]